MTDSDWNKLGQAAADTAMRAAVSYIKHHNLKADVDALLSCVRAHMKALLGEALFDAKAAIDAHMPQVAETTFLATMAKAGIEAAKEAGQPNINAGM